jgi:uracil phosphoribosyltransferase
METEQLYSPQVHLLNNPFLQGLLAKLCSPYTFQPEINHLVQILYSQLIIYAMNLEFPMESFTQDTRMTSAQPEQKLSGICLKKSQRAVVVNLARAGTYPSHICYETLHYVLQQQNIRQDHIFAARLTDDKKHVIGTDLSASKIGGDKADSMVIFPDPMGATGNTIVSAIQHYKTKVQGNANKMIALHLIITPEYLKKVLTSHPDVIIYALRLDRGLSTHAALNTTPGKLWEQERGLNEKQYIVPGGGGFGEIMNNSFV